MPLSRRSGPKGLSLFGPLLSGSASYFAQPAKLNTAAAAAAPVTTPAVGRAGGSLAALAALAAAAVADGAERGRTFGAVWQPARRQPASQPASRETMAAQARRLVGYQFSADITSASTLESKYTYERAR